jgi:predicted metal-dependent hydrolase
MHQITVGDYTIDVVRKKIKNLHLAVYPPTGRLRVAVPLHIDDETVRLLIISRLGWIKKHIAQFKKQERLSAREYVSGESHYVKGRRYLLNIINDQSFNQIKIRNNTYIDFYMKPGTTKEQIKDMMTEWYRIRLKARIKPLMKQWSEVIGVEPTEWQVRQMKTRWGSCNVEKKSILINLELAKKPEHCLEYIIVHELIHLIERLHNDSFVALMNKFLPNWRIYKDELNHFPLSHEETWEVRSSNCEVRSTMAEETSG